jgi:hypothetical protein
MPFITTVILAAAVLSAGCHKSATALMEEREAEAFVEHVAEGIAA